MSRGVGSEGWANEYTKITYLGGRRFAATIYTKPRAFSYEITGRKELPPKIAIGFVHESVAVAENVARLFEENATTGELKTRVGRKIVPDLDGDRGKTTTFYGDRMLGARETLGLDPTTTISPPTDDSFVAEDSPDSNYGSSTYLAITDRDTAIARVFIRFDLSSIPSGATIDLAKVRLYYYNYSYTDPVNKETLIYRVTGSWSESSITWNNQPSYASDFTSSTNMPSSYGWVEWTVTDDVQGMVDGTYDNYGWCIRFYNETLSTDYSYVYFYSKEYDGYDPELYVEYTTIKRRVLLKADPRPKVRTSLL